MHESEKMKPAEIVCCKYLLTLLLTNSSTEANSVYPDQTAIGAVWSRSTLFEQEVSQTVRQTTQSDDICCDWCFQD